MKSMLTLRPSAESAGHAVLVRGLQLLYVCPDDGAMKKAAVARLARALVVVHILFA